MKEYTFEYSDGYTRIVVASSVEEAVEMEKQNIVLFGAAIITDLEGGEWYTRTDASLLEV